MKALFSREDIYGIKLFTVILSFGINRKVASGIVFHVLGYPLPKQENPVDWETDLLNIHGYYADDDNKSLCHHCFYGNAEPPSVGSNVIVTMLVNLSNIKKVVDKAIG